MSSLREWVVTFEIAGHQSENLVFELSGIILKLMERGHEIFEASIVRKQHPQKRLSFQLKGMR